MREATRLLEEVDDREDVEDDADAGGERLSTTVLSRTFSCSSSETGLIVGSKFRLCCKINEWNSGREDRTYCIDRTQEVVHASQLLAHPSNICAYPYISLIMLPNLYFPIQHFRDFALLPCVLYVKVHESFCLRRLANKCKSIWIGK